MECDGDGVALVVRLPVKALFSAKGLRTKTITKATPSPSRSTV